MSFASCFLLPCPPHWQTCDVCCPSAPEYAACNFLCATGVRNALVGRKGVEGGGEEGASGTLASSGVGEMHHPSYGYQKTMKKAREILTSEGAQCPIFARRLFFHQKKALGLRQTGTTKCWRTRAPRRRAAGAVGTTAAVMAVPSCCACTHHEWSHPRGQWPEQLAPGLRQV